MQHTISILSLLALMYASTLSSFANMTRIHAEEKPKVDPKPKNDESPDQTTIDVWVKQLDHAQLTKREEAQRELMKAGQGAIPALTKAALSDKKELIEKSIAILNKLAKSEDKTTQEVAKGTLVMLSNSDQPSTAQRAKLALNTIEIDGIKPFEGWDKPNNPLAANLGAGSNRSVSVSNFNGKKTITVKEGEIETKLQDLDGGKISVKVTGGEKKVDINVKNLEELKQKVPEAHAIYTQHADNTGGGALALNVKDFPALAQSNEMIVKQLEQLKEQFKGNATMQQMIDEQLKRHKKR